MSDRRVNRIFRAFADETRLRILHLLTRGELCVCELMAAMDVPQSKMSRHLAYLRRAGLVIDRRNGQWRRYALAGSRDRFQQALFKCLGQCFDEVAILKRDAGRLEKLPADKKICP